MNLCVGFSRIFELLKQNTHIYFMSLITTSSERGKKNRNGFVMLYKRIIFYLRYLKNEFYSHLDTTFLLLLFTQKQREKNATVFREINTKPNRNKLLNYKVRQ